jgi:hypothetical protein
VYRFGEGNVTLNTSTDKILVINNGFLDSQEAPPTDPGTPYFAILGSGNFVEGNRDSFGYYDCLACYVAG